MEHESEQDVIIESVEPKILVKASAGSGKTSVLTKAVVYYRQHNPKDRIDVITFTRAATQELRDRLALQGIYDVNISTIHVWARGYLDIYSDLYHFKLRILYKNDVIDILNKIIKVYPKKVEIVPVYNYIMENKRLNIPEKVKATYDAIERRYIVYKRENSLYDFTDYPLYLYDVLKQYNENILDTNALFVDELQDVDAEQSHVFERVIAKKKFYIGDEKQMIYCFRGSSKEIFNRISKDEDFKLYTLKYNYRSYQEIVDYAMTFYNTFSTRVDNDEKPNISDLQWLQPSEIHCTRGSGGHVEIVNPFGECVENGAAYENEDLIVPAFLAQHPQILCRTNKQVDIIHQAGYFMATTIHQAKGLEYEHVLVVDFPIRSSDDVNVGYVALTRARDGLMVISLPQLLNYLQQNNDFLV